MGALLPDDMSIRIAPIPLIDDLYSMLVLSEIDRCMPRVVAVAVERGDGGSGPDCFVALNYWPGPPQPRRRRAGGLLDQRHALTRADRAVPDPL